MSQAGYGIVKQRVSASDGIIHALAAKTEPSERRISGEEYRRVKALVRSFKLQTARRRVIRRVPPPIKRAAKRAIAGVRR